MTNEQRKFEMLNRLQKLGVEYFDALAIRRTAMTLERWYEMECGTDHGCIERDEETGIPFWYNANSRYLAANDRRAYTRIPDREKGALKRLAAMMKKYPTLGAYIQTDPRGAPVYVYKVEDLKDSQIDNVYSSIGVAVYK